MATQDSTPKLGAVGGIGIFNAAVSAYSSYNAAKHSAAMADLNWSHNKSMALENLKLNQYITGRNKIELLDASADKALSIDVQEMKAKADAEVVQAAYGMQGGSAQQVLHAISRNAERAESTRLVELDAALVGNKLQAFQAGEQAQSIIGIRPIDSVSGALAVGSFAAESTQLLHNIASK